MRIHLLALPNCQTTRAYSLDGFAQATIRFARMMKDLGHTVFLYASEENEAPCDELVTVITKEEAETLLDFDNCQYQHAWIDQRSPIWQLANPRMIREIAKRKQPRDFICHIGGDSQKPVTDAHPELMAVEYSIGYAGSYAPYRVFESRAWQHCTYGFQSITDGRFWDTVIPLFFDPDDFTFRKEKEPFALYVGRLEVRKGLSIACRAAEAAGMPLKIIGHTKNPRHGLVTNGAECLGPLDAVYRNDLMSRASVVFCPTQYIEPFNAVAVEAQLCGTPVLATDFGGFTETIEHGKSGFRCNYLGEFAQAVKDSLALDHEYIRRRAVEKYSLHNLKHDYPRYLDRLMLLWGKGWDTI